jgi:hypothetical protein
MSETTTQSPRMPFDQMVEKYVALRDKVAEVSKRHKDELAPFSVAMATLEAWMLDALNTAGMESAKAPAGTAYKTTRTSTKVMNWTETLEFIRTKEAWDLLEARVSKTAVEAVMVETGQPVPGVTVTRETTLNVRRT